MTKQIILTQGQVALVSDWRYEELNQWKWQAKWNKKTQSFYATRSEGWPIRRFVQMHRRIMNTPADMECDHIDHSTLNNQDENLRNVTRSQNKMNSRLRVDNKLGQRCISPTVTGGYHVQIRKDHEMVFNKTFRTLEEAIAARDEVVQEAHGEFAYREQS